MNTLSEIRKIVKKKSRKHISPTCYRHHFLPVAKFAKILGQKLGIQDLESSKLPPYSMILVPWRVTMNIITLLVKNMPKKF